MSYMVCKNCEFYKKGECIVDTGFGKKVLVDDDYYCTRFEGAKAGDIHLSEVIRKDGCFLVNRFGGGLKIYNISKWGTNNYEMKLYLSLGNDIFNTDRYYSI